MSNICNFKVKLHTLMWPCHAPVVMHDIDKHELTLGCLYINSKKYTLSIFHENIFFKNPIDTYTKNETIVVSHLWSPDSWWKEIKSTLKMCRVYLCINLKIVPNFGACDDFLKKKCMHYYVKLITLLDLRGYDVKIKVMKMLWRKTYTTIGCLHIYLVKLFHCHS